MWKYQIYFYLHHTLNILAHKYEAYLLF